MDTKTLLRSFLDRLLVMGQEIPVYLFTLTQIVQPTLPEDKRTTILGSMFSQLPELLDQLAPEQFMALVQNPPLEAVALRLLLDLFQLHFILKGVSNAQLFTLSSFMPPLSSPQQQLGYLAQLQERFRVWNPVFLTQLHKHFVTIPMHLEREALLGM
jgi:hypothetical protein